MKSAGELPRERSCTPSPFVLVLSEAIQGADDPELESAFANPRLAVLGIVSNQIDDLVHTAIMTTLGKQVDRYIQVCGNLAQGDGPFAALTVECIEQFRDEHYIGCIALAQAVIEAIIRHTWQIKLRKKQGQDGGFDKNLEALHKKI